MASEAFTNRTFDEIALGSSETFIHTLTASDVETLALAAGDVDGFHVDPGDATDRTSAQGAAAVALLAALINKRLPGPGSRIQSSKMRYQGRIHVGDTLTMAVTATAKQASDRTIVFAGRCTNQAGEALAEGELVVAAPVARIAYADVATPEIILRRNDGFARLFAQCQPLEPVRCAVVHPCDRASLLGAIEAARLGVIVPVLVGPEARIRGVALAENVNLDAYRIVPVGHSHAAAARAVELARAGEVECLMKGSLHTDELIAEVVAAASGLRTARRVSHAFVMDVPAYPRLLMVTDAAVNIQPDLDAKADICRNAIELAQLLGIETPKLAILSAVETVSPKLASTIDAAALCKMADRGQIAGGVLDGPLAFDNAISLEAARIKGLVSPVAGLADILVVPDLESGNMLAKQLQYLSGADAAGIVLGARVPIALTSRSDSVRMRLASAAVMKLIAHARRARPA